MQKIGVFQEIDSGEIQFHYGFLMMDNKLFALDQLNNYKN
jgi:hypothetical protein